MAARDENRQEKIERDRIKAERKKLEAEKKKQKKEVKRRAKELAAQEAELDSESSGSGVAVFFVTLLLVVIWIGITILLIKLDVAGIGTNIAAPLLKDIPVLNKILPADTITETDDTESYYGYSSLKYAVNQIKVYESQIDSQIETIEAYQRNDPAARSKFEIFWLYNGLHAQIYYRVAHWFYLKKMGFIAR